MALDSKATQLIKEATEPIIKSALSTALVGAAMAALKMLTVSNYKSNDLTGDKEMHPTKDEMAASKVETSATETDAALNKDEVTAKDGDLSAAQTEAKASTGEATALEGGASAARTKAGAADIETKGLKMT